MAYAFSLVNPEEQEVLQSCFENSSPEHLKWAMKSIANWQGVKHNTPILHINSANDRIVSRNRNRADAQIPSGYFAVYTNADELNEVSKGKLFPES